MPDNKLAIESECVGRPTMKGLSNPDVFYEQNSPISRICGNIDLDYTSTQAYLANDMEGMPCHIANVAGVDIRNK
jgi:hypothetical protein